MAQNLVRVTLPKNTEPLPLLLEVQFRGEGFSCIGCGGYHKDSCLPACPIAILRDLATTIEQTSSPFDTKPTKPRKRKSQRG